jgi:hypothetical protein
LQEERRKRATTVREKNLKPKIVTEKRFGKKSLTKKRDLKTKNKKTRTYEPRYDQPYDQVILIGHPVLYLVILNVRSSF